MTKLLRRLVLPKHARHAAGHDPPAVRSQAISANTRSTGTCHSLATFSRGSACFTQ